MTPNTDRVISISLPDEVWRAFTQANPEPISWLKARIQESIDSARNTATGNRPPRRPRLASAALTRGGAPLLFGAAAAAAAACTTSATTPFNPSR